MRVLAAVWLAGLLIGQDVTQTIDRLRASWSRQDAAGVLEGSTRVVVQLPREAATAPLGAEQASRALGRLFVDATEMGLEVKAVRRVSGETVYAEMTRHFRVRGSEGTVEQQVFAAFRLEEGRWRLTELRIGTAGR
jgi:hypothetical protein